MDSIEKRRVSDHDAQVIAGVGTAVVKAGVAAAALVAAGPIGMVGVSLATELAGVVLEGQKARLAEFASRFASRTAELPPDIQDRVRAQMETDEGSRIFEVAWRQAAQEVDPGKLDMLAALLKNSLSSEELREHQTRWLLKLLNDLDAVQIVILQSFAKQPEGQPPFRERHAAIFEDEKHPVPPEFRPSRQFSKFAYGYAPETDEQREVAARERAEFIAEQEAYEAKRPYLEEQYQLARERHALYRSRLHTLVEMGLLGAARKRGAFSRDVDVISETLTPLGAALLKIIDAADHAEWGQGEQFNAVQAMQQSLVDIKRNSQEEFRRRADMLTRLR